MNAAVGMKRWTLALGEKEGALALTPTLQQTRGRRAFAPAPAPTYSATSLRLRLGVRLRVRLRLPDTAWLLVPARVRVALPEALRDAGGVRVPLCDSELERLIVALGDVVSVALDDGVSVALDEGVSVALDDGVSVALDEGVSVAREDGVPELVRVPVALLEPETEPVALGDGVRD